MTKVKAPAKILWTLRYKKDAKIKKSKPKKKKGSGRGPIKVRGSAKKRAHLRRRL